MKQYPFKQISTYFILIRFDRGVGNTNIFVALGAGRVTIKYMRPTPNFEFMARHKIRFVSTSWNDHGVGDISANLIL